MTLSYQKVPFYRHFTGRLSKCVLCHLMQSKLLSIGAETEKDRFKGLETRELLNDTEKCTSQVI